MLYKMYNMLKNKQKQATNLALDFVFSQMVQMVTTAK